MCFVREPQVVERHTTVPCRAFTVKPRCREITRHLRSPHAALKLPHATLKFPHAIYAVCRNLLVLLDVFFYFIKKYNNNCHTKEYNFLTILNR